MTGNSRVRAVVLSLLVVTVVSTGVVFEAGVNYADITRSEDATARVTEVTEHESGLEFRVEVTNPLDHPIRIEYVRLEIADTDESVGVSVPFNEHASIPPSGDAETVDAFVIERRYEPIAPLGESLAVSGHLEVRAYNDYQFRIPITESEVDV
jgi:hypothetical protein